MDLIDSDSSAEEFEDASESFNVEDDIFIDNVQSMKIQHLSKFAKLIVQSSSNTLSNFFGFSFFSARQRGGRDLGDPAFC